jgi:exodeoxyribonuclease-5
VKFPNKLRNATTLLAQDCAHTLGIAPASLELMAEWATNHEDGRGVFCGMCLKLERGECTAKQLPYDGDPFAEAVTPAQDPRFGLVYDMLQEFVLNDSADFWLPRGSQPEPPSKPVEKKPSLILTPEESEAIFGSPPARQIIATGERPTLKWNEDQGKAIKNVLSWYKKKPPGKQVYRLFGKAGSGKSSIVAEIAYAIRAGDGVPVGDVIFATFTGKAAAVLMSKGCAPASTIHSLIYKPVVDHITGKVTGYTLNQDSPLKYASLLICDEVSMVNEEMGRDLESFGVPILVVGDPGQLDPIRGEGYFTRGDADSMLTKVERVALENPLIYLALQVSEGEFLKPGTYGDSHVYRGRSIPDELIMEADQLICGMNRTRHTLNRRYRMLAGYHSRDSQFPVRGDRLMGLKNNKDTGVLNGTQWHASEPEIKRIMKPKDFRNLSQGFEETNIEGLYFRARSCDLFDVNGDPLVINTVCSAHHFDENVPEPPWRDIAGTDEYTFAYCGTVHKMQGSQFPHIVVSDESFVFRDQEWKHRYTAITRASERADIFL